MISENKDGKKGNCYILIGIYLCKMCPLKGAEKKKNEDTSH